MEEIMARLSVLSVLLVTSLVLTAPYSHAQVPITACGTISQPGIYVVENDLVATNDGSGSPDCLDISAPNVIINMQGATITVTCTNFNPSCYGLPPAGGSAINIMSGADHVILSNINVQRNLNATYAYGIVDNANYALVTTANLNAMAGVTLNNASYSIFKGISYSSPLDPPPTPDVEGPTIGPIIAINGGGHNVFSYTPSAPIASAAYTPAVLVAGSSYNTIQQVDASDFFYQCRTGPGQAGMLLTENSSHNIIEGNLVDLYLCGNAIEVDLGSDYNLIQDNIFTLEGPAPAGLFAALDENPNCGHNLWTGNTFVADTYPAGQPAVSPACIH
jgi:hypothetical protein